MEWQTLAIDPSGNFTEGKGHTGIVSILGDDWTSLRMGSINAKDYETRHQYWSAVIQAITGMDYWFEGENKRMVIESYVTRNNGFTFGKQPETAMLIGVLVYWCEEHGIPYYFQMPSQAKTRFKDERLTDYVPGLTRNDAGHYFLNGKVTNDHERDALKHLLYFKRYKEPKL